MTAARTIPRRAFTLIELLMAILIIGMLAGLLLVAINAALKRAQQAQVLSEIGQMSTAIETFKNQNGGYPTTIGFHLSEDNNARVQRTMRNVAKMFPRYTGDYNTFYNDVGRGTAYVISPTATWGLDINTLDPAESLVFWLGGFPDPNSETKVIGFRSDPANPFSYWTGTPPTDPTVYLKNRTKPYAFDPKRLVDRDQDGWWEYIPPGKTEGEMAPYVYFDSGTYNVFPYYPREATVDAGTVALWGHAVPYGTDQNALGVTDFSDIPSQLTKLQWVESQKYQIIAPGRDGNYGRLLPQTLRVAANPTKQDLYSELRLYPSCARIAALNDPDRSLPDAELDNLTNFGTSKLGDERE